MSNNVSDDLQTTFRKRGIKTRAGTEEILNFVGKKAKTTFAAMSERQSAKFTASDTDVATLGEAYSSSFYETLEGSTEKEYESVYGARDFTVPAGQDEQTKELLDEIFGNNDNDPTGSATGLDVTEAREVIGKAGTTKLNTSSLKEKHLGLLGSQGGIFAVQDEESLGIRGVEDKDAPIDPIA